MLDHAGATRTVGRRRSVELFAGAGGLALGCEQAGFESAAVLEWDRWACDTVRENRERGHSLVKNWRVFEGDIRAFDWSTISEPIDLLAGGPPCQPFSMGGKHMAHDDRRDMFPAATHAIRSLTPRAFILENVRGLTRPTFHEYYRYIQARLALPEYVARDGEAWHDHLQRLDDIRTSTVDVGIEYTVTPTLVNAADYGVPQQRHRVFMVGFNAEVNAEWHFPDQTHSREALMRDQWVTGDYWERHNIRPATSLRPGANSLAAMMDRPQAEECAPWRTVRDALADMPRPLPGGTPGWLNHAFQAGARSYSGHTGSHIDLPAKTLKAGGHGVPGGENMLRQHNGQIRYFSIRESARLQTFPDNYELHGAWGEAMRQLGNAVPVLLGKAVAESVKSALDSESDRTAIQRSMETAK
ncbi:DNA (cytosine-5-)-methyltransferase [Nocardioides korecus]